MSQGKRIERGKRIMRIGTWLGALGALTAGGVLLAGSPQDGNSGDTPERYARVKTKARVFNYQDQRGKVVAEFGEGAILRIHDVHAYEVEGVPLTWFEVSAPGGMPVWVFGEYLTTTEAEGILRVTGNGVRMRPLPESSVASFPLQSTLDRGERVEFVARANTDLPFAEDWIQVWALGARGFVQAERVSEVADLATARAQWSRTRRVLPDAPARSAPAAPADASARTSTQAAPVETTPPAAAEASAPRKAVPEEAFRSFNYGNTLLANAIKKDKAATEADFDKAIHAYRVVLDMVPADASIAVQARERLEQAEAFQILAASREEARRARERQQEHLEELRREQENRALRNTAHWGRFMGRGWVERKRVAGVYRWYLRWSGEVTFEIDCQSGRYDLEQFQGYEIGVQGTVLRERILPTEVTPAEVALLDVTRIEVISGGRR